MRTYCFTKPICILLILIGQPKHYGHAKKISEQHQWLGESSGEDWEGSKIQTSEFWCLKSLFLSCHWTKQYLLILTFMKTMLRILIETEVSPSTRPWIKGQGSYSCGTYSVLSLDFLKFFSFRCCPFSDMDTWFLKYVSLLMVNW